MRLYRIFFKKQANNEVIKAA